MTKKLRKFISLISESILLLREQSQVQNRTKGDVMNLYKDVHSSSPVFILSTGRTGTLFLTEALKLSSKVKAHHEPDPVLNYHGKLGFESELNDYIKGAFDGARYELIRDAFILNKTYIETNNRLTFLAPAILSLYPNAKFVYLHRDVAGFVMSGLRRNWYEGTNIHDEGRIVKVEGWADKSSTAKIAWLWKTTNSYIESFLSQLPEDQKFEIESNAMFENVLALQKLLEFCGANDIEIDDLRKKQKHKSNSSSGRISLSTEQMSEIQKEVGNKE